MYVLFFKDKINIRNYFKLGKTLVAAHIFCPYGNVNI
jgi:hypothetical protein